MSEIINLCGSKKCCPTATVEKTTETATITDDDGTVISLSWENIERLYQAVQTMKKERLIPKKQK